jgi:response regulator of citrate/malate metabolism
MSQSIRKAYNPELVVLVVEDDMIFIKEMKHALPQDTLVFARTLEDAKARYDESMPNLIFLDISLPDGSGFELLDYIMQREPEAYVLILTGSKIDEDVVIATKKGARGYIIKPFTHSRIEQAIQEYLDAREAGIKSHLTETRHNRQEALAAVEPKAE